MNNKNIILLRYVTSLMDMVSGLRSTFETLEDVQELNDAAIKVADIQMEGIRAQSTIIQAALDNYEE